MGNYTIPKHPIYDEQIRKLENSDPANAELTFDPLFSKIITNVAAVKKSVDKAATSIDELGTAATKNVGTGANDVAAGNHNHDLAYTAKSHSADTTLHITSIERSSWNSKETPSGAQTKADSAKNSAIATAATDATAKANTAEANAKAISGQALNEHVADGVKHITAVERNSWNGKANTNVASTSVDGLMAKSDKVKLDGIAIQANNYVHPASHPASMITGLPSSLPANGGNAATVNGKTVESNVPLNAKFTDTIYTHPNDANTRHVTDAEKATWSEKANTSVVTTTANGLMASADKVKLNGIATSANNYSHPATHPASMITGLPTSLPASGGNAATVNGKTVESNVPVNAKFTDTVYLHPNDVNTRHVTDTEKAAWNAKANTTVATASANGLMAALDKTKLDGVAVQANKTVLTNNLTTVSTGTALDAAQGKVLADQIGGLLPLNGSKKMTGVLEMIGGNSTQIRIGAGSIDYWNGGTGDFTLSSNCYRHADGSWRYSSDGTATILAFTQSATVQPGFMIANTGKKDAVITWSGQGLLTDQTGVRKSGDTMSGGLGIESQYTQLSLSNPLYPNKATRIINNGTNTHIQDWKSASNFIELILDSSAIENAQKLFLHIPDVCNSYLYGEHNPPHVAGNYIGDGVASGKFIAVGFQAAHAFTSRGNSTNNVFSGDGIANGFMVYGDANINGLTYWYTAFK